MSYSYTKDQPYFPQQLLERFTVSERAATRVVVGVSGGVDSSVSALILKQMGFDVVGLFMKNWEEDSPHCTSQQDYQDGASICQRLDIPYYGVNLAKDYWDRVFQQFLDGLQQGETPNPDVLCNREIKFDVFFQRAKLLGAHYLATGHYAQIDIHPLTQAHRLKKSHDQDKDQSYFLHMLKDHQLEKTLFPIGHLTKAQVRSIAKDHNLETHGKKDSTGLCFIGERPFRDFISQFVSFHPGEIQTTDGKKVGEHQGIAFYTIGQRKGLSLGGPGEPWFVVGKNVKDNILLVERGTDHPALYARELQAKDVTWVSPSTLPAFEESGWKAKIRYRQQDQDCSTISWNAREEQLRVSFRFPQRAITPQQSVVFYQEDICLGGGQILFPVKNEAFV
jgi:tRNA-specific 2-thiouridylase